MRHPRHLRLVALPLALLISAIAAPAQTILTVPDEPAVSGKIEASDTVKSNMASIRRLVADNHTLITHRRFAPSAARKLASDLQRHVAAMRADAAASALSDVLTPLGEGASGLAAPVSGDSQLEALAQLETGLDSYAQRVNDPDWKPLR